MAHDDHPEIELLIAPDGSVRFEVSGVSGEDCDALEAELLKILRGEIVEQEHTPEYYTEQATGLVGRLLQRLGKK